MASGEYILTSPLFKKFCLKMDNGKTLTVSAPNNSAENIYIQSCKLNGKAYEKRYITYDLLREGGELYFELGPAPSSWATTEDARPTSLTKTEKGVAISSWDLLGRDAKITSSIKDFDLLADNDSLTDTVVKKGDFLMLQTKEPSVLKMVTLTSAKKEQAPGSFIVEGSRDGVHFEELLKKEEITFLFDRFIRPFALPKDKRRAYSFYRITFINGGRLSELEFLA